MKGTDPKVPNKLEYDKNTTKIKNYKKITNAKELSRKINGFCFNYGGFYWKVT